MVNVALDESDGILEYETSLAKQQTWVKFNPGEIDEKILMENIKKRTGYNNLYVQNKN
jgi:hypothetical protein